MCLENVTRRPTPTTLIESGWKEFNGRSILQFKSVQLRGSYDVPLDQWITAEEKKVSSYTSGFHVYSDERQLRRNGSVESQYRRVYFRNAHTVGIQDNKTISVAKEMYVPSDPDAWPPL